MLLHGYHVCIVMSWLIVGRGHVVECMVSDLFCN